MMTRLRYALTGIGLAITALALSGVVYVNRVARQAPTVHDLRGASQPQPSVILSSDGQPLDRVQQSRQEPVTLSQVSPFVIEALIATEDHRFRDHRGVDWLRCAKALERTLSGRIEGGSTITQQLARNLFPQEIGRSRSINRKVKEIITAMRIEQRYGKDQILEAYLNTVPFLYNAVGIEAASRTYFGKHASELDATEAATLVGMLKGTQYFNPVQHPDRALKRRNLVLTQMGVHGKLSPAETQALKAEPLKLDFQAEQDGDDNPAPHFTAYVRKWLEDWADQHDHDLARDGLIVHTTLDSRMQAAAAEAVESQTKALQQVADVEWSRADMPLRSQSLKDYAAAAKRVPAFDYFWRTHPDLLDEALRKTSQYRALRKSGKDDATALAALNADKEVLATVRSQKARLEAGFVAIDPRTGAVRAWVGSRDHGIDQFDHVAQAERQPGSTFKPIVYAAALERGISPFRAYMDTPVEVRLGDGTVWRPTDMSGSSQMPMTMWEGLVYSKNTITTQVMQDAGLDNISALARAMGITRSKLDMVPSMALGTSPVTLLELASVYATIADQGRYREPYVVERITDSHGQVLADFGRQPARQALSVDASDKVLDMMRGVVRQGTGQLMRSRFVHDGDLAGKTGTTQHNTDGWFLVMHPQIVAGAWVGFNDQRISMRGNYWGQGGHSALLLVGDFMQRAVKQSWVDTKLAFASPPLPMALATRGASLDTMDPTGAGPPDPEETPYNPITTDPAGMAGRDTPVVNEDGPPRSAQELGEVMKAMGRDPETGAPVERSPMSAKPEWAK